MPSTQTVIRPEGITSAPDAAEMTRRVKRVQARMQAEELDFYVASCPDNVYYLTHFAFVVHERLQ
jgi:Xaa-Pro dipeptidase